MLPLFPDTAGGRTEESACDLDRQRMTQISPLEDCILFPWQVAHPFLCLRVPTSSSIYIVEQAVGTSWICVLVSHLALASFTTFGIALLLYDGAIIGLFREESKD